MMKDINGEAKKSNTPNLDSLMNKAQKELADEATEKLVQKLKVKMKELRAAKKITQNIQREIDELKLEIEHELESL